MATKKDFLLSEILSIVQSKQRDIRVMAETIKLESGTGPIGMNTALEFHARVCDCIEWLVEIDSRPNLVAFARQQFGDDLLDQKAKYIAARAALVSMRDWVALNFPANPIAVDASGWRWNTTAMPAAYSTRLNAIITAIDPPKV